MHGYLRVEHFPLICSNTYLGWKCNLKLLHWSSSISENSNAENTNDVSSASLTWPPHPMGLSHYKRNSRQIKSSSTCAAGFCKMHEIHMQL